MGGSLRLGWRLHRWHPLATQAVSDGMRVARVIAHIGGEGPLPVCGKEICRCPGWEPRRALLIYECRRARASFLAPRASACAARAICVLRFLHRAREGTPASAPRRTWGRSLLR